MEKVLPFTSLLLFDIKFGDGDDYRKWTGHSNRDILHNLSLAVARRVPVIIRVPLIPGINDTEEQLYKVAQIAREYLNPPRRINILPYHRFGMGKYVMLDRAYSLPELITQKEPEIQKDKEILESLGLECEIVL
jgi:pyruvate formate lyase activating enzyme